MTRAGRKKLRLKVDNISNQIINFGSNESYLREVKISYTKEAAHIRFVLWMLVIHSYLA